MKKRILPRLFLVFVCISVLIPLGVSAVTPLDPDATASLTLHYQKEGTAFADLQIGIYRVAEAFPDGKFALIEPFASCPINIHGITTQAQWNTVAQTLYGYIAAQQVQPDREATTDEKGTACFTELETGLYFVRQVVAENSEGTYVFNQFMVYVPTPQPDGTYNYTVEAKPKCTGFTPVTRYTVTKLWQDEGMQAQRPEQVTVEIYKDTELQQTQVLHAGNNWSYTWTVPGEDRGQWTVVEQIVPEHYQVTVQCSGENFALINTRKTESEMPPQTGDTTSPMLWILVMCMSGAALLLLGIYRRRQR